MIIELPNGNRVELDNDFTIDDKVRKVEELVLEFEDYICEGWETTRIKFFLNGLSNYLCWHKEEKYSQDKDILSKTKDLRMKKYDSKNILFSSLNKDEKQSIGIYVDNNYEESE